MNLGFKPQVSDELLIFIYKYLNRNISDDTPISSFDSKSVSAFNAKTGGAAIIFLVGLIISISTYIIQPTFAFLGLVTMIGSGYVLYDEYRNKLKNPPINPLQVLSKTSKPSSKNNHLNCHKVLITLWL
jgi:hypothetical protein